MQSRACCATVSHAPVDLPEQVLVMIVSRDVTPGHCQSRREITLRHHDVACRPKSWCWCAVGTLAPVARKAGAGVLLAAPWHLSPEKLVLVCCWHLGTCRPKSWCWCAVGTLLTDPSPRGPGESVPCRRAGPSQLEGCCKSYYRAQASLPGFCSHFARLRVLGRFHSRCSTK